MEINGQTVKVELFLGGEMKVTSIGSVFVHVRMCMCVCACVFVSV